MALFEIGGYFPPEGHKQRINRYAENKKLFKGEHFDLFEKHQNFPSEDLYISVNLAGMICKKSADFLFGDSPTFSAGRQDDSPEQEALDRWVEQNDLNMRLQQSATGNAFRGDSFFKVRWGQKWNGKVPEAFDPFRVIIESQNPKYVFPETSAGDSSQIIGYHIAIPMKVEGTGDQEGILKVESHYPNEIIYQDYRIQPMVTKGTEVVEWKIYNQVRKSYERVETGVPFPMVVHVPNYATDDSWEGIDDLTEHKSMFDELNRRLTAIGQILDKHADPAIAVPTGVLGEDEYGNPTFVVGRDKVFETMGKDDVIPQYITWNGQLQSAFEEVDRITEMILTNAEIPSVALGKGESGTSGSSGLAIKFRMNSLLSKIKRKRQFYDKALKELFMICQMVEDRKLGSKKGYEFFDTKIQFKDGLPSDEAEQANIMNIRTGGKATLSQKTALMRQDGLTEEQAEKEIERMDAEIDKDNERDEKMFADPSAFQTYDDDDESDSGTAEQEEVNQAGDN